MKPVNSANAELFGRSQEISLLDVVIYSVLHASRPVRVNAPSVGQLTFPVVLYALVNCDFERTH